MKETPMKIKPRDISSIFMKKSFLKIQIFIKIYIFSTHLSFQNKLKIDQLHSLD